MNEKERGTMEQWVAVLAKAVFGPVAVTPFLIGEAAGRGWRDRISLRRAEELGKVAEEKMALVKELIESGIDPTAFDRLISAEIDRRLKIRFGVAFLTLTVLFTAVSYLVVILNSVLAWNISEVAITALIIETPIQFIGLLYIIARNLFPQKTVEQVGEAANG